MHHAQIESDLHLESLQSIDFAKILPHKGGSHYLFLAGDICPVVTHTALYHECISYCAGVWNQVFVVAGNHEYYNNGDKSIESCDAIARQICMRYSNVTFLQRDSAYIPELDLHILGTTLWSDTAVNLPLNDYRMIWQDNSNISYHTTRQWHRRDVAWLSSNIEQQGSHMEQQGSRILVLTHHLPSFGLLPLRYRDDVASAGFASSLEHLACQVNYWICGHSHVATDQTIGRCRVVANPRGYKGETVYRPKLVDLSPRYSDSSD
jgi:predicted phosphodiesterase